MLVTNDSVLLRAAKRNYGVFKIPTSEIPSTKKKRYYTPTQQADLDINTSVNKIGEIINYSQRLNSLQWHRFHSGETHDQLRELQWDVVTLDNMSGAEIDKAKKEFTVDNGVELNLLRQKYDEELKKNEKKLMPYFFAHIDRCKGQQDAEKKDYKKHDTSMDYLQTRIGSFRARPLPYGYEDLPFETVLDRGDLDERKVNRRQITRIIAKTREYLLDVWQIQAHVPPSEERNVLVQHEQDDYVASILKERINRHTMQRLLRVVDNPRLIRERHFILRVLLQTKKSDLLNGLIETKTIVECVRIGRSFDEYEIPEGQKTVKDMTYKMPTEALTKSALKRHLRKPQNRRSSKSILPIIKVSAK